MLTFDINNKQGQKSSSSYSEVTTFLISKNIKTIDKIKKSLLMYRQKIEINVQLMYKYMLKGVE